MSSHKRNGLTKSEASRLKSDGLPTHISDSESRVKLSKELLDAAREIDGIAYQYSLDDVRNQGFGGKSPVLWLFKGKKYALGGNWRKILMSTCEALNDFDSKTLARAVAGFSPNYFALSSEGMRDPYFHAPSGVWIDKALSATDIIFYSRKLCLACHAPLDQIGVVYSDDKGLRRNVGCDERQVEVFENDIQKCYPLGFDFSENSKRLVEERAGLKLSVGIERELQSRMFERKDGLWFFANQICTDAVSQAVVSRCAEWLDKYPLVVLSRLGEVLIGRCENLEDSFDHGKFAEFCIRQSEKGNLFGFNGKRGNRICYKEEIGEESAKTQLAAILRGLLAERMDAVSVSEIEDLYPSITEDWLLGRLHSLFQDVFIVDLADKAYALKLLEHFYLPEDFGEMLTAVIGGLEGEGKMLSSARLLDALNQRYNVSFLRDYAMNEELFKQIVSHFDTAHRSWTGAVLGEDRNDDKLTFRALVEKQFSGVFSHDEFYEFGRTAWGWGEEHRAWHHKQLWKSFIRYDEDHWSSVAYFVKAADWATVSTQVTDILRELLGSNPFVPFAHITQHTLDSLPSLILGGDQIEWTRELLASVAYHCLPKIGTLNHAKLPYEITTLLVPFGIEDKTDGVEYMLSIYKERNWHNATVERAFVFLKENNVRVNFVDSLKKAIEESLSRGR